jgi:hypothetical protein
MPGLGLGDLPRPLDRHNPALDPRFDDRGKVEALDRAASRALVRATELPNTPFAHDDVCRLAHLLDYGRRNEALPRTRASRLFFGDERMRVGGATCRLIGESQERGEAVSFVTLCGRDDDVTADQFWTYDPPTRGRRLSGALDRIIKSKAFGGRGWAILFLDCEVQLVEGLFRFHWHGWATGRELAAIDLLRETRAYHSPIPLEGQARDGVRHRIRLTRQPLTDLRYHSIYPVKPEWRARTVSSNQAGNRERSWKVRLPEPYRTMERLFYDRWAIQNIAVVRGLRVTREGLVATR